MGGHAWISVITFIVSSMTYNRAGETHSKHIHTESIHNGYKMDTVAIFKYPWILCYPITAQTYVWVCPDYNSSCVVRAPRAGIMDTIYHHLQIADITLDKQDTMRIVQTSLHRRTLWHYNGFPWGPGENKIWLLWLSSDCHCIIHTLLWTIIDVSLRQQKSDTEWIFCHHELMKSFRWKSKRASEFYTGVFPMRPVYSSLL